MRDGVVLEGARVNRHETGRSVETTYHSEGIAVGKAELALVALGVVECIADMVGAHFLVGEIAVA